MHMINSTENIIKEIIGIFLFRLMKMIDFREISYQFCLCLLRYMNIKTKYTTDSKVQSTNYKMDKCKNGQTIYS